MNERVRELVEQAVLDVDVVTGNETLDDELAKMYIPDCFAEKFAELIVKECANVLKEESERLYKLASEEDDELFVSNFEICAEKCWDNEVAIKNHFGVE